MNLKYVLGGLLLFAFVACNKEKAHPEEGNNTRDTTGQQAPPSEQQISIEHSLFTNPRFVKSHKSDPTLMKQLANYLNYAPKGSAVHISIYLFDYKRVRDALKRAYLKGVEVHLLIDSGRAGTSAKSNAETFSLFRSLLKSPSEMITVNNDNTEDAIDHEKYALFSEVDLPDGRAENLVFATSHNFIPSATEKINDAVVMTSKGLYDAFLYNWEEVKSRASQGMTHFSYEIKNVGDSITAYFFPRRKNGQWDGFDTIVEQLDSLDKDSYAKDTIDVFMAFWSGERVRIAKKLVTLQKSGATVQVITRNTGQGVSSAVMAQLHELHDAGGYVKILDITKENDHSKCMLIKGIWNGRPTEMILTGSHNYTDGALEDNNEFLLRLKNSALFKNYWNYYKALQSTLDDFSGWGD